MKMINPNVDYAAIDKFLGSVDIKISKEIYVMTAIDMSILHRWSRDTFFVLVTMIEDMYKKKQSHKNVYFDILPASETKGEDPHDDTPVRVLAGGIGHI